MPPIPSQLQATAGRRAEAVYRALLDGIREGRFEVHSKLPPENELARAFSVSRPVVRSALALLRQEGLVRSVQGSGSIVIQNPDAAQPDTSGSPGSSVRDLQRCFEFRVLIEGEAAYAATLRQTPQTLRRMADSIYKPHEAAMPRQPAQAYHTFDFHHAVVEAADSIFLKHSFDLVVASAGFRIYLSRNGRGTDAVSQFSQVNAEHIEIFRLIERRHAAEAREAMRAHVQRAYDHFIDSIPVVED